MYGMPYFTETHPELIRQLFGYDLNFSFPSDALMQSPEKSYLKKFAFYRKLHSQRQCCLTLEVCQHQSQDLKNMNI